MTAAAAEQLAADEGLMLLKSEGSSTGYKGVTLAGSTSTPYMAQVKRSGKTVTLGFFATAEEAALEYARTPEGRAAVAAARAAAAALEIGNVEPANDDDQVGQADAPQRVSQREQKRTHGKDARATAKQVGAPDKPIILDTSRDDQKFYRSEELNAALRDWIRENVPADETFGGKRSKVFQEGDPAFEELRRLVAPMLGKAGLLLYMVNALIYDQGKISMIMPHKDSHHRLLERVTVVFDLTQCAAGETLHMHIPGYGYLRVPDAEGRQLCTVMPSTGMPTHSKVSTGSHAVLSLALFCYSAEHAQALLKLVANEATTHLSGISTVVHDLGVYDKLRGQEMISVDEWPAGEEKVRAAIEKRQLEIDEERKNREKATPSPQPPSQPSTAVDLPSFKDSATLYEYAKTSQVAHRVREMFSTAPAGGSEGGVSSMDVDAGGSAPMPGQAAPPGQLELPPLPRLVGNKRTLSVAMEDAGRNGQTLEVTVPTGAKGGDTVMVGTFNGAREVKVPRGLKPGDKFTITLQVLHIVN